MLAQAAYDRESIRRGRRKTEHAGICRNTHIQRLRSDGIDFVSEIEKSARENLSVAHADAITITLA